MVVGGIPVEEVVGVSRIVIVALHSPLATRLQWLQVEVEVVVPTLIVP